MIVRTGQTLRFSPSFPTEALDAIKKAYDESTEAEKKVDSTEDTVKQSSDIREEAEDLQGQVQPNNTRDLNKLKQNMATQPDLTPVAKQVSTMKKLQLYNNLGKKTFYSSTMQK